MAKPAWFCGLLPSRDWVIGSYFQLLSSVIIARCVFGVNWFIFSLYIQTIKLNVTCWPHD